MIVVGDELTVDPVLPEGMEELALEGMIGRWGRADAVAEPAVASG